MCFFFLFTVLWGLRWGSFIFPFGFLYNIIALICRLKMWYIKYVYSDYIFGDLGNHHQLGLWSQWTRHVLELHLLLASMCFWTRRDSILMLQVSWCHCQLWALSVVFPRPRLDSWPALLQCFLSQQMTATFFLFLTLTTLELPLQTHSACRVR